MSQREISAVTRKTPLEKFKKTMRQHGIFYLFVLPGIVLLILFAYMPMAGIQIAFRNYKIRRGIWGSPWVGLENFAFLKEKYFWQYAANTVIIAGYRMLVTTPLPLIVALLIHEIKHPKYKKLVQSFSYLPHFVSWIIVAYMLHSMLALDSGIVNSTLQKMGLKQIHFLGELKYFRHIVVWSSAWKGTGWGTIIYLAALSGIDQEVYEAAIVDGAGRFRRIWHINIPGILPTIVILLILNMPGLLSAGYEQIMPLVNASNMQHSNVLDVYIVNLGLSQGQFSVATAIGLLLSVINLGLVLGTNAIAKALGQEGFV